jgi:hypothetical protein
VTYTIILVVLIEYLYIHFRVWVTRRNKHNTVSLLTWSFETWGCTWRALSGTLRCFIYWPGWHSSWIISCRWSPAVDILHPQSEILFTIYIHIHHSDYSYRHIFRPWYSSLPPCVACWSSAPCVVWKNMLLANSAVAWFLLPWLLLLLLRERCFVISQIVSAIWVPNSEESVFVDAASHSASRPMKMTHSTVARQLQAILHHSQYLESSLPCSC